MNEATQELLEMVKCLASNLGRSPTKNEFLEQYPKQHHRIKSISGGFTVLLQMAGLDTYHLPKPKITNEVFRRDPYAVIEEFVPREPIQQPEWPKILILGDTHFPWVSKRALEKVYEFAKEFKPSHIVQMGDLYDFLSHSKFPRSQNNYPPTRRGKIGA